MNDTFDSTSDRRTENNTMRQEYRTLTDNEKEQVRATKTAGDNMLKLFDQIGASREMSLARTKLEEAVMWAVKHITR